LTYTNTITNIQNTYPAAWTGAHRWCVDGMSQGHGRLAAGHFANYLSLLLIAQTTSELEKVRN